MPNISAGEATVVIELTPAPGPAPAILSTPVSREALTLSPSTKVLLLDLQLPSLFILLFLMAASLSLSEDLNTLLAFRYILLVLGVLLKLIPVPLQKTPGAREAGLDLETE